VQYKECNDLVCRQWLTDAATSVCDRRRPSHSNRRIVVPKSKAGRRRSGHVVLTFIPFSMQLRHAVRIIFFM
jgi:hypothetical protein